MKYMLEIHVPTQAFIRNVSIRNMMANRLPCVFKVVGPAHSLVCSNKQVIKQMVDVEGVFEKGMFQPLTSADLAHVQAEIVLEPTYVPIAIEIKHI